MLPMHTLLFFSLSLLSNDFSPRRDAILYKPIFPNRVYTRLRPYYTLSLLRDTLFTSIMKLPEDRLLPCRGNEMDNFYTMQSPGNADTIYYLKKIRCYTFFCQKHFSIISIHTWHTLSLLKSPETVRFYRNWNESCISRIFKIFVFLGQEKEIKILA